MTTTETTTLQLTDRQRRLMALLAEGHSDAEVAELMALAPTYIRQIISTAMRANGARNRLHLAVMIEREAPRRGLA